jgi:DNA (cytosine-5)-methyltransferase 1
MAVESVFGGHTVWHSEIDPAASKVLAHRWPGVPNLGDITKVDWADVPAVDILCGGFPCQDVSAAGKRAGIKDGTRSGLWSVFADAIEALQPRIVVIENVRGLLSATAERTVDEPDSMEFGSTGLGNGTGRPVLRAMGAVLGTLSDIGYDAQWTTIAAADVGAPHRRERVFIVAANTKCGGGARIADTRRDSQADSQGRQTVLTRGLSDYGGQRAGVDLLPTPRASDPANASSHSSEGFRPQLGEVVRELLPTPNASDCSGGGMHPDSRVSATGMKHSRQLIDYVKLEPERFWGKYQPAIQRWERIAGPAPVPTEPNKNGNPRLSASFSEWLMGWPEGWVTDPAIGISRNDQLRIIGNGVCPQQAHAAIRWLAEIATRCELA